MLAHGVAIGWQGYSRGLYLQELDGGYVCYKKKDPQKASCCLGEGYVVQNELFIL